MRWEPRKPAPPVTSIRLLMSECLMQSLVGVPRWMVGRRKMERCQAADPVINQDAWTRRPVSRAGPACGRLDYIGDIQRLREKFGHPEPLPPVGLLR